ncbi:MAG: response regulator transcription factor [Dermabacter sp.]|nr:response regulator transcription factor [Dermabacter sp.]
MIRVVIADDHPVVRSGLRAVVETAPDIAVVADVERAALALEHEADVVTMDLRFPDGLTGVEAIRALLAREDPPAVLVLTNYDDDADILAAIEAGASGYLLKDAPPAELLSAIRRAHAGESVLAPAVATTLMSRIRQPGLTLTPREADVLAALDRGLSNREISRALFLGETTVKTHLARLYGKLGVSSRTAALAKARELGLMR